MRSSLISFENDLNSLEYYILGIELESSLLGCEIHGLAPTDTERILSRLQDHISPSLGQKRTYEYKTIIISLYGFLEQYIESLIRAYVVNIAAVTPRYLDLPQSLVDTHVNLSFELISRLDHQRHRGRIDLKHLISNLHTCLTGIDEYHVNAEAFVQHTANFRASIIDSTFKRVGIDQVDGGILKCPAFQRYLQASFPEEEISSIKPERAYYYLNDLAERRNEVAHGSPSQLLSNSVLLEYIKSIRHYGQALYEITYSGFLFYKALYQGIPIGKPIVVHGNNIVCLTTTTKTEVGDMLIAEPSKGFIHFQAGDILEIQMDRNGCKWVGPGIDVGIRVPFKVKPNQYFFLLPQGAR